nr:histidine kinase [Bacteroidota bacterium]
MKKINVDSLLQIIPDLEGTKRIDARNRFAFALCSDFPDSSIAIVNNTIAISKKLEYQKGLADAYFNLGNSYFFMDSIKPMVLNYLHALRLYEDLEPSIETGLTLYQLTIVNRLTGRYEKAISYCRKALQVYRLLGEYQHEIDATYVLGGIFRRMDNRDSSLFYYDKALEILEKYPNNFLLGSVYNDYGLFYLIESWQGNKSEELLQEGIQWFFKCWELDKKHHHPAADMATPIYNIGSFYLSTGTNENINKGLAHLMLAKSIVDTAVSNIHTELMVYRQLARIEKRKGHINEAIALYNTGISKADNDMAKFSIRNYHDPQMAYADEYYTRQYKGMCYEELFEIYREIGDYKAALEYFILSEKATEEIYLEENSRLIAILEADSETEKIQSRIDMLAKDNELKTLKIDQSRTFNYGLAGMIIILVLVGLLFLRQNKMKNEHKTVLLEQKLLRLQMNPHFIFNALSNILNFIDGKENAKASNYLTTFSKLLRTTLESTRQDLVPFEKEVGSLKNYLELQKLRYGNKFDYAIEVDEGIDEEDLSIPPMLVQPFIENAIEHGIRHKKTPGRIDVRFFLVGKKILCEVEDDGVGREKAWETEVTERSGHKSLATEIIKDRIKTLNKKFRQKIQLEIIDKKSETLEALGTKVVLDIPYA